MKNKIENILLELGVTPDLKGFDYICKAVFYISSDRTVKICSVYDFVASDYDTSSCNVERAIRYSISRMVKKSEAWKKYMGIKNIKNSAVLRTLALKIKED